MCEAILIKCTHAHTLSTYVSKKKVKYFWIYETLKTIVFMFYCKDVKYDMCELKKIMIRKIKYSKNLRTFHWSHKMCH